MSKESQEVDFKVTETEVHDQIHYDLSVIFFYENELHGLISFNGQVYEKEKLVEVGRDFNDTADRVIKAPGQSIAALLENILDKELEFPSLMSFANQ